MAAGLRQIDAPAKGSEPPAAREQGGFLLDLADPDPPQPMNERYCVVEDPRVLADLATTGEARWVLTEDSPPLAAFDQVRLSTVRVWLDGAVLPDGGTVEVRVSGRGSCCECSGRSAYRITSQPLVCGFAYRVSAQESADPAWRFPDGTYGHIELDGVVDDEVGHTFFQPAPFAPWHLRVHGDALDLTRVSRVVMEFTMVGAGASVEAVSLAG